MRSKTRSTQSTRIALTVFAAVALGAWRPAADSLALGEGSRLWFEGTSTVRAWTCTAPQLEALIVAESNPVAVLDGQKSVRTVQLTIPVARLDCNGNRTMNGHMWKALNAEQHATIEFTLTSYDVVKTTPASGTLAGTLSINGRPRPVTIPVEFASAEGALRVTGNYALKMTDWGVEPPKLMLGTLKVGETVTVQFDLLLQH